MYHQPTSAEGPQEITSHARFAGDHGGPAWEPMTVYHNTIIARDDKGYDYGTHCLSPRQWTTEGTHGSPRRTIRSTGPWCRSLLTPTRWRRYNNRASCCEGLACADSSVVRSIF